MSGSAREGWHPSGLCSQFVCDIAAFGDGKRTDDVRAHVRKALYGGLAESFAAEGIPLDDCHHEDRGDGVMVIVPPHFDTALLITTVVTRLRAAVRRHNAFSSEAAQMRLRVAVHTGEAHWDGTGLVGEAVNHTFRILDAGAFKDLLRDSGADLALIVSQRVYDDVVRHGRELVDPGDYRQIDVEVKETQTTAWVSVPGTGLPNTGLPAVPNSGAVVPSPHRVPDRDDVPWLPGGEATSNDILFELVDHALEIPQMAAERSRERVVSALPLQIRTVIPRSMDARSDTYEIIRTCLDYPGGLQELLSALRGFAGDSLALGRLERAIARLLLGP
ncbi:hypothetical protein [Actinomadura sp. 9N407]|uniref:effector-associated domain 2-containing protein n=1 Tax=Actinomadura sp. 9N407 TaxID=3375154 RepID=UPI00378D1368